MLKSSLILGSVYSCVKEPLRKTPDIGIGGRGRENIEREHT